MRVSEGIHRLTRGVTNFYLIEESGKYTLVDAGTPADWAFFARSLAALGGKLADLDAVLLTHAHSDHTGFAERARAEAGARVWIHRADEQAARTGKAAGKNDGRVTSYLLKAAFYRTTFSLLRRGGGRMIPIAEVSAFAEREQIDVPGRPRAVHAPGHTPGSAAILLEGRALLTGDVMATENPLTGRLGPQIMPSGLNADTAQALASLDALRGIDADLLLPGHGDPWTGGVAEAVQRAKTAGPS